MLQPWEIAVSGEIAQFLVVSNPQPVVNRLHEELHILAGFELYHNEPALPRYAQKIHDASVASRTRRHLTVEETRIDAGIDPRGVRNH